MIHLHPGAASRGLRSGGGKSGGSLSRDSSEAEWGEQAQLRGPTRVAAVTASRGLADAKPSGECLFIEGSVSFPRSSEGNGRRKESQDWRETDWTFLPSVPRSSFYDLTATELVTRKSEQDGTLDLNSKRICHQAATGIGSDLDSMIARVGAMRVRNTKIICYLKNPSLSNCKQIREAMCAYIERREHQVGRCNSLCG